jgi:phosphatidylserine/phosphatidylglycerophosphate/cardiolipin synthase-like enzyme
MLVDRNIRKTRDNLTHQVGILGILTLAWFLTGCWPTSPDAPVRVEPVQPPSGIQVFFTRPLEQGSNRYEGGPDEELVAAIDAAQESIELAIMHLNLWSVRDALIEASRRGVQVRIVTESDYILEPEIVDLELEGIQILGDRRESLMHHKFMVVDGRQVWTGSMNFTVNGAYRNNNNLVLLESEGLAMAFQEEFFEMFDRDLFGDFSLPDPDFPVFQVGNNRVELYFSPDENVEQRLVELITDSSQRIQFMAYVLTSDPIANELLAAHQRGVEVQGVVEATQADSLGSDYLRLLKAGLSVRRDSNPKSMHHKVILIDDSIVITGSYNFSKSAKERNDENLVILHDPDLVLNYLQEFERIYAVATP